MHLGHRPMAAFALAGALVLPACGAGSSTDDVEVAQQTGSQPDASPTSTSSPSASTAPSSEPPDITSRVNPASEPRWSEVPETRGLDPARIRIPSIGVDADVIDLGLNPDGTLEVPDNFANTGWFSKGPQPGKHGASVVAGHIDSTDGPAVFYRLDELVEGDQVIVESPEGDTVTFQIETVEQFDKDEFPTERVYSFTPGPTLRLVTCGGPFNDTIGHYEDNIIAFARRVPPEESTDESDDA